MVTYFGTNRYESVGAAPNQTDEGDLGSDASGIQ
jgi:hypothetical protein